MADAVPQPPTGADAVGAQADATAGPPLDAKKVDAMKVNVPSRPNATDSDRVKELMVARDEAMAKLSSMVGIQQVKEQVASLCETAIQNQRRRDMNINNSLPMNNHMLFLGPPGTGKSSVAKIVAELLHKIGAAPSDKLTVFDSARTALVAGVVE